MLRHGILGLLNYGSMTGYDITRTFRDSLHYFWNAQTSQIYRELQTLKENGWATDSGARAVVLSPSAAISWPTSQNT